MVAMEMHAFFHSAVEFIFEDKNSLHFWGPNERFGTHEKLSWWCKVGQISSRGTLVIYLWVEIVMGRNGYGPKLSWAEINWYPVITKRDNVSVVFIGLSPKNR